VQELAKRVLTTIRDKGLINPGDRIAVAVSGGADSVALLHLLLELRSEAGIVLSVAHVNHKLRGEESEQDERFVADLARQHGLDLHARALPLESRESGIEAAARHLRYDFFRQLMADGVVSKVATAHTLDDQAETVLLRILRGTGLRGLSGIHPRLRMEDATGRMIGEVVRPLLGFHRYELEPCLRGRQWREDSSNRDPSFSRNRVRHGVLPQLEHAFGGAVVDNLANLAEIARAEEGHWQSDHPEVRSSLDAVAVKALASLPLAAQRRLIRNWMELKAPDSSVSFALVEDLLELASGPAGRKLELSSGTIVRRTQKDLVLDAGPGQSTADYEYQLIIPGQVRIRELGIRVEALKVDAATLPNSARDQALDPARLPNRLLIRNWRPGDRFWPAHSKQARKVKELLSDRHLTGREKKLWPVAVAEGIGLVWVRGFPVPDALLPADNSEEVLWIRYTNLPQTQA
jgi:tRNA(Ile)-lysidine synthase